MSGASGKVPAAIHVTPEVLGGGPLGRCATATSSAWTPKPARWKRWSMPPSGKHAPRHQRPLRQSARHGPRTVRLFRNAVGTAEEGGATFGLPPIFEKEKATV
jgi:phosphogluconate dehydratase